MEGWSDEKFVHYMGTHSRTPRALFHRDFVNRLLELCEDDQRETREWVEWHYCDMKPYLDHARKNMQTRKV